MERLQKVLAASGLGSRRECEKLILEKRVTIDGKVVAVLGTKVDTSKQKVCCDGELIKAEKKKYYLFYKPRGVLCTNAEEKNQITIANYFSNISYRLFHVGRLDKDSEGLLLITNDGKFAQHLLHPKYQISKTYELQVKGYVKKATIDKIKEGIWLSEGKVAPKKIRRLESKNRYTTNLEVILGEGKKRELRRIFARVNHPVKRLIRTKIGNLTIGDLEPGKYRALTQKEIEFFKN